MRWIDRRLALLTAAAHPPFTPVIYGVKIMKNDPDPFSSVTYTDDAAGLSPSSGNGGVFLDNGWSGRFPFDRIRPCVLQNGQVRYYLNPGDFTRTRTGGAALLTGGDGDVMVEFPKIWYAVTQDSEALYVRCANYPAEGFTDAAFSYGGAVRERFYLGAYLASLQDGRLRSVGGALPAVQMTTAALRSAAQLNGSGYECLPFSKLILLQALYLVRFKSLNGQEALGQGLTASAGRSLVGVLDRSGMDYGSNNLTPVKFCGLEDFWGHCFQFADGILSNADGAGGVLSGTLAAASAGSFSAIGAGYTMLKTGVSTVSGYLTAVQGTSALGFLPAAASGSGSAYFCDNASFISTGALRALQFGGYFGFGDQAGPFNQQFSLPAAAASAYTSTRLCWCGA